MVAAACTSSKASNTVTGTTPTTGATSNHWTTSHPFKAGFIYAGAASDAGWTHAHDVGRLAAESHFNGIVKTEVKDNVPEGPKVSQVIQQLINDGNKIIFSTSGGYQVAIAAAAKANPKVLFEQATGTDLAPNLSEYYGAGEDGDYLSGMAAGYATKSGKIGFVAPYPIPEVIREINSYTMGARLTHPGATVRVVWTNSWFDPDKEQAAAQSLVSAGVDVLGDGQDSPTTGQVAAAANLRWTGYDSDQTSIAPKAWLTATTYQWGAYYTNEIQAAINGTWTSRFYYGGFNDGFVVMAPFGPSVTSHARAAITAKLNDIKSATFDPFTGPILKQDGSVGVPSGTTLPVWKADNSLSKYSIDFLVQGVVGSIPKA